MDRFFQMFPDTPSFPGISRLGWIMAHDIPQDDLFFIRCGLSQDFKLFPSWIVCDSNPVLNWSAKRENNVDSYESSISFSTRSFVPDCPLAWVFEDAAGNSWLLAGKPPHYGCTSADFSSSKPDGDAAVRKYKFSVKGLPVLLIS